MPARVMPMMSPLISPAVCIGRASVGGAAAGAGFGIPPSLAHAGLNEGRRSASSSEEDIPAQNCPPRAAQQVLEIDNPLFSLNTRGRRVCTASAKPCLQGSGSDVLATSPIGDTIGVTLSPAPSGDERYSGAIIQYSDSAPLAREAVASPSPFPLTHPSVDSSCSAK